MSKELFIKAIARYLMGIIIVGLLLFIPAGTIKYWNAWLLMGLLFIPMFIAGIILLIKNPELLKKRLNAKEDVYFFSREKLIVGNYMNGLHCLSEIYDDKLLLTFIDDLKNSDAYIQAFHKSAQFAEKRNVPDKQILKTKADIDQYFLGGNIDG